MKKKLKLLIIVLFALLTVSCGTMSYVVTQDDYMPYDNYEFFNYGYYPSMHYNYRPIYHYNHTYIPHTPKQHDIVKPSRSNQSIHQGTVRPATRPTYTRPSGSSSRVPNQTRTQSNTQRYNPGSSNASHRR
jgi:hypothetical protein